MATISSDRLAAGGREQPREERRIVGGTEGDWLEIDRDEGEMMRLVRKVRAKGLALSDDDGIGRRVVDQGLIHGPNGRYHNASGEYPEATPGMPEFGIVDDPGVVLSRAKADKVETFFVGRVFEVGTRDKSDGMASCQEGPAYCDEGVDVAGTPEGYQEDVQSSQWAGLVAPTGFEPVF